jgi:hypothetical protein
MELVYNIVSLKPWTDVRSNFDKTEKIDSGIWQLVFRQVKWPVCDSLEFAHTIKKELFKEFFKKNNS